MVLVQISFLNILVTYCNFGILIPFFIFLVVLMVGTYIENYERNLIENAFKETKKEVALKMKVDGVSFEFIFKYCGVWV